jgi:uncharacterized protein YdhG (YjbR/CyaY superfamily)
MLKRITKPTRRPRSSAYGAATTIDEYLARLEPGQRDALEALRRVIRQAAPKAEEVITYGIPAFRQNGFLVGFAASAKHCSLHPMNNHTVAAFAAELAGYSIGTGTIRFTPQKPLPAALVRNIVKARIVENDADAREKAAMKRPGAVVRPDVPTTQRGFTTSGINNARSIVVPIA